MFYLWGGGGGGGGGANFLLPVPFNPLNPNSEENEISLYIITTCSNIQVMRRKEKITEDKMSCYLEKYSLLVP